MAIRPAAPDTKDGRCGVNPPRASTPLCPASYQVSRIAAYTIQHTQVMHGVVTIAPPPNHKPLTPAI
eukprot:3012386-Prymnesium_polylepis.1